MISQAHLALGQQGQFTQFALLYCCAIPVGLAGVLGAIYFGVRWYADRSERD